MEITSGDEPDALASHTLVQILSRTVDVTRHMSNHECIRTVRRHAHCGWGWLGLSLNVEIWPNWDGGATMLRSPCLAGLDTIGARCDWRVCPCDLAHTMTMDECASTLAQALNINCTPCTHVQAQGRVSHIGLTLALGLHRDVKIRPRAIGACGQVPTETSVQQLPVLGRSHCTHNGP